MRRVLPIISWIALAGAIVPSLLYMTGDMSLPQAKFWMLVSTVIWFVSVPFWMDRRGKEI